MPHYVFTCDGCLFDWEQEAGASDTIVCRRCARDGVTSSVSRRVKRKDARRRGRTWGAQESLAVNRTVRSITPRRNFDASDDDSSTEDRLARRLDRSRDSSPDRVRDRSRSPIRRAPGPASDDDSIQDEPSDAILIDPEDSDWVPAPEFDPVVRFTAGGSFEFARGLPAGTTKRITPWTGISLSTGASRNTAACFANEKAEDHGAANVPGFVCPPPPTANGKKFEWCHLIADSLGGQTAAANLFCGTFHVNTAMLCIENVLRGRTEAEVQVEVDVRAGSHVGERVVYRVRRKASATAAASSSAPSSASATFERVLDGLATGCTKEHGRNLAGEIRAWVKAHLGPRTS